MSQHKQAEIVTLSWRDRLSIAALLVTCITLCAAAYLRIDRALTEVMAQTRSQNERLNRVEQWIDKRSSP